MKLSFLDFGQTEKGSINAHKVIENLFSISAKLDELGCYRYWLGEHYEVTNDVSWFSPRIILPLILANTENLRVGAGGELIKYHAPLTLAHDYILLNALFNGRIDLGIAKGGKLPDNIEKELYVNDTSTAVFIEKIKKTAAYLNEDKTSEIQMPLQGTAKPQMWFLGAARNSFESIAKLKGNLSMSIFHKPQLLEDKNIARDYKEMFYNLNGYEPEVSVSVLCFCVNSEKEKQSVLKELKTRQTPEVIEKSTIVDSAENMFYRLQEISDLFGVDEILTHNDSNHLQEKNDILQLFEFAQKYRNENIPTLNKLAVA